jgi:vacuolar-type H+-ATPase subunit I/STV1
MEQLANISQFEALMTNGNTGQSVFSVFDPVENAPLDLSSNPDGSVSRGQVTPAASVPQQGDRDAIPEWGNSLNKRMGGLENRVVALEDRVVALEDNVKGIREVLPKLAVAEKVEQFREEVRQTFAEIKQAMANVVTKQDLQQFMGRK